MEIFIRYLQVFVTGGLICLVAQILINKTKMTSARILVLFMLIGVILEITGAYKYIAEFGHSGASIPICGFGSNLCKGALKGAKENGILGAISGGMTAVSGGLSVVIVTSFIYALIFKSKSKKF